VAGIGLGREDVFGEPVGEDGLRLVRMASEDRALGVILVIAGCCERARGAPQPVHIQRQPVRKIRRRQQFVDRGGPVLRARIVCQQALQGRLIARLIAGFFGCAGKQLPFALERFLARL